MKRTRTTSRVSTKTRPEMMKASSETYTLIGEREVRDRLARYRELVDARLDKLLPAETREPRNIHSAIRWSVFAGGKRFRPLLLLATGQEFGAATDILLDTACALE